MTPNRHPSEAILAAYAAGSLTEGPALVIATHLSLCRSCRLAAAAIEAIGGAVFESLPEAAMSEDALAHALARIERPEPAGAAQAGPAAQPSEFAGLTAPPDPLRQYLAGTSWRGWVPGLAAMQILPRDKQGGSVFLLRVSPGMSLAHHGHSGLELSLILSGAYRDEFGHFGPGDLAEIDESMSHRPVAEPGAPCICLIASERPLRFTGRLARALQPMLGI